MNQFYARQKQAEDQLAVLCNSVVALMNHSLSLPVFFFFFFQSTGNRAVGSDSHQDKKVTKEIWSHDP